jgi:hypothetical protein
MSRLSATTAFAPPGPRSLAMVVNRWMRIISRSFMAEQGREGSFQEQVCLSCRFQMIISNSPRTGLRNDLYGHEGGEPWTLTRPVLVGYLASSRPYHPAGTYSLPVSRLPIAKQQALGLINLGCQEGGTAAVWMDFLHESPMRLYDLFLAGPFIETQNFIGLVTCHFG